HDPREIGLLYYVMASSQTLGDGLKRVARYSQITNEALVVGYREGNRLIVSLSYSGVSTALRETSNGILHVCCITNLPHADGAESRTAILLDCSLSIGRHFRNGAVCRNESGLRC